MPLQRSIDSIIDLRQDFGFYHVWLCAFNKILDEYFRFENTVKMRTMTFRSSW